MAPLLVKIVRHGQTHDNLARIMQGHKDDEGARLNETGLAQAVLLAKSYGDEVESWRHIWASDLGRASVTASTLRSFVKNPAPLTIDKRLRERDMGSFSGFPLSHLEENGHKFPEDAETMKAMRLRGQEFWESIIVPLAQAGEGGTVGLVSHGAFLLNTFLHLVEIGLVTAAPSVRPSKLPNTSVTTVLVDETGLSEILVWGDVSHLLIPSDGTATPNGGQKPTMVGNMEGGE